jgi:hypothetical protein
MWSVFYGLFCCILISAFSRFQDVERKETHGKINVKLTLVFCVVNNVFTGGFATM